MLTKNSLITRILFIAGILIILNVLAKKLFLRLDLTTDKRYSLSGATKDILKDLSEPVTITAYFSENLPPDIARTREEFKNTLEEYHNISRGNVVYEFINPNKDEASERTAQQNGVSPVMINVRERDQVKQQRAYLGAVLKSGEQTDIIPYVQPGVAMEFALSSSIKKLSATEKPVVGFLQGHGEPSLAAIRQVNQQLNVLNQVQPLPNAGLKRKH